MLKTHTTTQLFYVYSICWLCTCWLCACSLVEWAFSEELLFYLVVSFCLFITLWDPSSLGALKFCCIFYDEKGILNTRSVLIRTDIFFPQWFLAGWRITWKKSSVANGLSWSAVEPASMQQWLWVELPKNLLDDDHLVWREFRGV